ncbi:MAG: response regulator transcription factor [Elusimicrobiota bacterium]
MTEARRILLIDDDEDIHELVRLTLAPQGYELSAAFSGKEGLRKAVEFQPHVILLDLLMPDLNGVDVFRQLQSEPKTKETPVVVLTGLSRKSKLLKSATLALGAASFLRKPVDDRRLRDVVASVLTVFGGDQRRKHPTGILRRGPLRIDLRARRVRLQGRLIDKIPTSRYVLLCVIASKGGAVSKDDLMAATGAENRNNIEKSVQRLRADLGPDGEKIVITVPGGYRIGDLPAEPEPQSASEPEAGDEPGAGPAPDTLPEQAAQ